MVRQSVADWEGGRKVVTDALPIFLSVYNIYLLESVCDWKGMKRLKEGRSRRSLSTKVCFGCICQSLSALEEDEKVGGG